jgi:predicted enzyme related to lactoylglutathione lyase
MERVLGIGGVFVRSRDRESLSRWYRDHLGLAIDEAWWGAALPLRSAQDRKGAYAIWSAFPPDTAYFGSRENGFMMNFRVRDLHAMLDQLRAAGCAVDEKVEESEFGRFGWVTDPEGRRVELWEPPDDAPPA